MSINASEDGDEPMGEAPDITPTGFQVLGTDHLGESPVAKILAAADDIAALAELKQIIAGVTALHEHMYDGLEPGAWEYCGHCATTWPCETMRIVERVAL